MLKNVSLNDWITLAVGVIGFLTVLLQRRTQLPSWARRWLAKIGLERIQKAIDQAATVASLTPDERRAKAVEYLQRLTERELGFPVPTSIANLLVEFVYQQWKRAKR